MSAFETMALDIFIRAYPIEMQNTRIVEIGDEDFDTIFKGQTPLNAKRLKQLIETVLSGEPKVLVVDLDTARPEYQLLKDIKREGTVIIWARKATVLHDAHEIASAETPYSQHASGKFDMPEHAEGALEEGHQIDTGHSGENLELAEAPKSEKTETSDHSDGSSHSSGSETEIHAGGHHSTLPLLRPLPVLGGTPDEYRDRSAMAVMTSDLDGMVRSYRLQVKVLWDDINHPTGELTDTVPWAAVKAFMDKPPKLRTEKALFNFTFTPDRSFAANQVEKFARGTGWKGLAKDKIVVLGGTYGGFDTHATPVGMFSGSHLIGVAIESHLQDRVSYPIDPITLAGIDIAAGVVLVAFTRLFPYRWALLAAFGGSMIIAPLASVFLYSRLSMWFSFVPVLFGVNLHLVIDHFREVKHMVHEIETLEEENKLLRARLSGTPHVPEEHHEAAEKKVVEEPMPD